MAKVHLGTISHGTLRTEDLLEAFTSELESLARQEPQNFEHLRLAFEVRTEYLPDEELPDDAHEMRAQLEDALQEYAPPFVYFGSHPGDGADFGFWPDHDALEDAARDQGAVHDADGYAYLEDDNVWLHINDHGNIALLTNNDGQPGEEIWSVV